MRKKKNLPRERERERIYIHIVFKYGKNMDWMKEMMSNLYKIKWEEEESNYKKEERMKVV